MRRRTGVSLASDALLASAVLYLAYSISMPMVCPMAETETPVEKIARLMHAPLKKMSKGEAINSVGHFIDLATDLSDDAAISQRR